MCRASLTTILTALSALVLILGWNLPAAGQERLDRHGDPLPEGVVARLGTVRLRELAQTQLALSPDGRWLACAAQRDGVSLWDTTTGTLVKRFPAPRYFFQATAFSADGKHLVAPANHDNVPGLFEVATGKLVRRLIPNPGDQIWALSLSPDGKLLATGEPRKKEAVRLWDTATGKVLHTWDEDTGHTVPLTFTPDGKALALGNFKGVRLVDVATGKLLQGLEPVEGIVHAVAVSPDGRHVAACVEPPQVRLWDARTGRLLHTFPVPLDPAGNVYGGRSVAFSADSRTLFFDGLDRTIRAHDVASGRELWHLKGGGYPLAISANGKVLAAGSSGTDGALRVWELPARTERCPRPAHRLGVRGVTWSPDGKRIATLGVDALLRVWEPETGKHLLGFPVHHDSSGQVAWSPDGQTLHTFAYASRQYDPTTGRETGHVPVKKWPGTVLGLSPDRQTLLISLKSEHAVLLWDLRQSRERDRLPIPTENAYTALALSPDGRLLAVGSRGYQTQVWDLVTRQRLWQFQTGWASELAFSSDGRLLFGGRDKDSRGLWARRADTGKLVYQLCDPDQRVEKVTLSPDGRLLAVLGWVPGSERRDLLLIEVSSAQERYRRSSDTEWASAVVFSPDGRRVATASHDCAALVWDVFAPEGLAAGGLKGVWEDLLADARTAHAAVARLVRSPGPAVTLLEKNLAPAKPADAEELRRLIAKLVDDDPQVRQKAEQALAALDRRAEFAVRRAALEGQPAELRNAAACVLERIEGPVVGALLRQLRAVEVLEHVGTPEAQRLLERLARGAAEARLTVDARLALDRLQKKVGAANGAGAKQ